MNQLADAMEPYLTACGIRFKRNNTGQYLYQAIWESNEGHYDLHIALHSNAAPRGMGGSICGTEVYYYQNSAMGCRAADIMATNFKKIYSYPSRVKTVKTKDLCELVQVKATAVLIEVAYHDNWHDAKFILNNTDAIARNLVESICCYLGVPFTEKPEKDSGEVDATKTGLPLRARPHTNACAVATLPDRAEVAVLGKWQDWYVVEYNGQIGYSPADRLILDSGAHTPPE